MTASLFPQSGRSYGGRKAKADAPRTWSPIPPGAVLLSIDPSIANCGWGILRNDRQPVRFDSGTFHPGHERMNRYDHLLKLIWDRIDAFDGMVEGGKITHAVIEVPRGGGVPGALMLDYARAVGVCEAACYSAGLVTNRVSVGEWKGNKKKGETAVWVKALLQYEPRTSDESDALALGVWMCNRGAKP